MRTEAVSETADAKNNRLRKVPMRNRCRHFNGIQHERCDAGMVYHNVSRVASEGRPGCALRLPCLHANETEYPCERLSRLTDEEVKQQDEETVKSIDIAVKRIYKVRLKIINSMAADDWNKFVEGSIRCPICKTGRVKFTYAGHVNGHIHACCTTPDCVSWGE